MLLKKIELIVPPPRPEMSSYFGNLISQTTPPNHLLSSFGWPPSPRYVVWCHLLHLTRPDPSSSPPRSPFIIFWLTLPSPWKMSLIASPWICKWNVKNMWYSIHWSKGTLEALYLYMVHRQFASPTPLSPVFYGCKPPPPCLHEYCLHSTATYLKISMWFGCPAVCNITLEYLTIARFFKSSSIEQKLAGLTTAVAVLYP